MGMIFGGDEKASLPPQKAARSAGNYSNFPGKRRSKTRLPQAFYQAYFKSPSSKDVPRNKEADCEVETPHVLTQLAQSRGISAPTTTRNVPG